MRKIWIIAKREYLERVRTKSFIVMTFLIPALALGGFVVPTLMMKSGGGTRHLVVVCSEQRTGELIRQQLLKLSDEPRKQGLPRQMERDLPQVGSLVVDVDTNTSDSESASLSQKVNQKQLDGAIFATGDALARKKVTLLTRDVSSFIFNSEIERALNEALRRDLLKSKGLSDKEIDSAFETVDLAAQSPTGMGNAQALFLTVFGMAMIFYIVVLLHGISVMRAILEEKTSRVMEVMLSTAQAKEMMAGKILGVGAVGLTQIAIWALMVLVPSAAGLIAAADLIKGIISLKLIVYFAVFFLLGFALYSTLCAAVGAMVNSDQESQQLQFIVMMPMIISVFIMVNIIQSPGSPVALWASLFPLTAPLIMFLRVALQSPPWWQVALSIGLMVATIYGLVLVCGRIYRVGILMYGKKPTLPELMRWLRYS
ncbi:MAG TPA: ABC transporter permease [Candidatus Angelobacter sp.]